MEVNRKTRLQARLENLVFLALFLSVVGLLGWLSTRYAVQWDWTAAGRNTLSQASKALLDTLEGPVQVTAFVRENNPLRERIREVIARYQRYKPDIRLTFVNPDTAPDKVRELGITEEGELVIAYQGRSEKVQNLDEESITNALARLARGGERWAVFLSGHGERDLSGQASQALSGFARVLKDKGFHIRSLNLAAQKQPAIPDNTTVLVIASPRTDLLPGEVKLIRAFVEKGGNLLWLHDPGPLHGLEPLSEDLGVSFMKGIVVDPVAVQLFGAPFALVAEYPLSPITRGLDAITLFPEAAAIDFKAPEGWEGKAFLETADHSWLETGKLEGSVAFDEGEDIPGPLTIGVSLEKEKQRIVVVGDGDFLSNAYVGNGGNLLLGLNIFNWLSQDEGFISIPPKTAPDARLDLSPRETLFIALTFLVGLPILLGGGGLLLWWRRRRR